MNFKSLLFLTLLISVKCHGQLEFHVAFQESSGNNTTKNEVNNQQVFVSNKFNRPERVNGVIGKALRLDGYSTHATAYHSLSNVSTQLSIEAWYSTESFSSSTDGNRQPIKNAAIISQQSEQQGFAIEIGPYGEIVFVFHANDKRYEISTSRLLKKYVWNHIVATIDLDNRIAKIYVNGQLWASQQLENHNILKFHSGSLLIGKSSFNADVFGISATHANGAIDDVKIYRNALTENEITSRFSEIVSEGVSEVIVFEDFESNSYENWTKTGNAFGFAPAEGTLADQQIVTGYFGNRLVNTFFEGDGTTGTLTSPPFQITKPLINMLVGGGNYINKTEVRLLINGEIVRSHRGVNNEKLEFRTWDVKPFIGSQAQIEIVDFETGGWGHINVDHITFENDDNLIEADLTIDSNYRHGDDHLRPRYHPMPNTSWANEAYGFMYYDDTYHLFFQKNPNGPDLYYMHWGHLTSPDLVNWKEEKVAIAPDKYPGYDDWGNWSGTSILDYDNTPVLIHTGVNLSRAAIGISYPKDDDLVGWEKFHGNPVIPEAPAGLMDFRDPYLWKADGTYYMIVGSGKANKAGGAMPLWSSVDMKNWTYKGRLHERFDPNTTGFFWEMPAFIKMKEPNIYAFVVNALIPEGSGHIARGLYWIGTWENEIFSPFFSEPKTFEGSKFDHLSPAIGEDKDGLITYIGIIPETRSRESQLEVGWRQTFSISRVLRLMEDNTLGHYAHPNLCRFRGNQTSVYGRTITTGTQNNLPEFSGNQTEFKFKIKASADAKFTLKVLKSANGEQYTSHYFDVPQNKVIIDRRQSSNQNLWGAYRETDYVFNPEEIIELHAFIDRSVIELFLDNTVAYSSRAYPLESSVFVDLEVLQGNVEIIEAHQWERKAFGSQGNMDSCPPENIPNRLRTFPNDRILSVDESSNKVMVYPNPTKNSITIRVPTHDMKCVRFFSADGKLQLEKKVIDSKIEITDLNKGVYFLEIVQNNYTSFKKLIIE